ncbi:MAG: acylphosphatase [Thermofilaceae archaeon]|nr:acylphosphatase [Thermofilaceae archaeon]MCX8180116.1 acylphosphatase [Thermofilaceae archaeon]MDW8004229.1 acylphosphatase [Thermofilaceae archaeon]
MSKEVLVRAHIFVEGMVQGVGFRYSMQRIARRLGVKGWVKNLRDGRVEAVLEGPRERVEELIEWAKRGPSWAVVDRVEVIWEEYTGEFSDFEIRF